MFGILYKTKAMPLTYVIQLLINKRIVWQSQCYIDSKSGNNNTVKAKLEAQYPIRTVVTIYFSQNNEAHFSKLDYIYGNAISGHAIVAGDMIPIIKN